MIEESFFGEGASLHHVGLVVPSIREVHPDCEPVAETTQKVSLAFIQVHGLTVELLEPLGDDSPIVRTLESGTKLHHLCFEVPDLEAALGHARPAGFHRLGAPVPAPVFDGRRIVWAFSKSYGLFELVEQARP